MTAVYNNAGHAARYACTGQNSSYGEPFCQSLKAAPVDAQVTSIVLQALEPAALEASLAVAADLQAERAALEQQWRQRLERALQGRPGASPLHQHRAGEPVGGANAGAGLGGSLGRAGAAEGR